MQTKAPKTVNDVRGRKIKCINFQKCPLCYGCRRYNSIDPDCMECKINSKINICNTDLHKDEITARMITKEEIKIKFKITFKNNSEILTIDNTKNVRGKRAENYDGYNY